MCRISIRQFRFGERFQKSELRRHRKFEPALLREMLDHVLGARSMEYRAGFLDAIGAYVLLALEGCQLSLGTWDVLAGVKRR